MFIFAENFKYAGGSTVLQRFPGSVRADAVNAPDEAFPLYYGNTLNLRQNVTIFDPTKNNKCEIRLLLSGDATSSATAADRSFRIFGAVFGTGGHDDFGIMGLSCGDISESGKIHIILEPVGSPVQYRATIIIDDVPIHIAQDVDWVPSNKIDCSSTLDIGPIFNMRPYIEEVVIAYDTPIEQIIGDIQYHSNVVVVDQGNWTTSDDSTIIEATDKVDVELLEPYAKTVGASALQLAGSVESSTALYMAGSNKIIFTDVLVNGDRTFTGADHRAMRRFDVAAGETINIIASEDYEDDGYVYNNDDVGFGGEIGADQFATFQELSVLCGLGSTGTLNTGNGVDRFLRFMIDGEELIVPKIGMRYAISWQQIYQAGLVYGVDGFGLSPSGANKNQKVIIEVKGRQYQVSLLTGTNSNPSGFTVAGYDLPTIARSQFSRLFYPLVIDDPNLTSYTDIKLAEYTMADLRLISASGYGGYNWVQETRGTVASDTNRHCRGSSGPSYVRSDAATSSYSGYSWRPAFKRLS